VVITNRQLWTAVQTLQAQNIDLNSTLTELRQHVAKMSERESWLIQHVNRMERERALLLDFILNRDPDQSARVPIEVPQFDMNQRKPADDPNAVLSADELFDDLGDERAAALGVG